MSSSAKPAHIPSFRAQHQRRFFSVLDPPLASHLVTDRVRGFPVLSRAKCDAALPVVARVSRATRQQANQQSGSDKKTFAGPIPRVQADY